jgi:hypothetical protein
MRGESRERESGRYRSWSDIPQVGLLDLERNEMLERMLRLAPAHYFRAGFLSQMALNWLCLGDPEPQT